MEGGGDEKAEQQAMGFIMRNVVKDTLIAAIRKSGAIQTGDFVLASGQRSNLYIDLRKLVLSHHIVEVRDAISHVLTGLDYNAIGGPGFGAAPLIGALLLWRFKRGFLVRPESKAHGANPERLVVGSVQPGDYCVMIEDVVTTGGSLLAAIDAVEREIEGAKVVHAIAILDRGMEVGAKLAERSIGWNALLTLEDLAEAGIREIWDKGGESP
jgi:orotate phosphoribosyltransferase